MARPKKNNSQSLVNLTVEFYEQEGNGDPSRLRYTALAAYAKSRGYNVEEYHFRRDAAVRAAIEEIQTAKESQARDAMVAAYKNIDIDALIRHCSDLEDLKQKIAGLDYYWRGVYEEAMKTKRENEELRCIADDQREKQELRRKVEQLQAEMEEARAERKHLLEENACLRQFLRKNVYPALAEELLRQEGLPVPENRTVRPEALGVLIEGDYPQAFTGKQGTVSSEADRQAQLLARMKEQIEKR